MVTVAPKWASQLIGQLWTSFNVPYRLTFSLRGVAFLGFRQLLEQPHERFQDLAAARPGKAVAYP